MSIIASHLRSRDTGLVIWLATTRELLEQAATECGWPAPPSSTSLLYEGGNRMKSGGACEPLVSGRQMWQEWGFGCRVLGRAQTLRRPGITAGSSSSDQGR